MSEEQLENQQESTIEAPREISEKELENISYHDYLKLMNPDKDEAEIQQMIRKENRGVWMVRFEVLALVLIIIAIIVVIIVK